MSVTWSEEFQPKPLLDRIASIAKVTSESVSFDSFAIQDWLPILEENLVFDDEMPSPSRGGLVWKTLVACAKRGDFTPKTFLRVIAESERQYLAQPRKQYYLLSSLSLEFSPTLALPAFHGCRFLLSRGPYKRFDHSVIDGQLRALFRERQAPRDYTSVRVAVQGRTPEEAGAKALSALELARALLNFQINLTKGMRIFSGRPQPVNLVAPGPVSTLHERSGKLAKEIWLFEPDYVEPATVVRAYELKRYRRNERWFVDTLRTHPYRTDMERVLGRYSRALDSTDYDFAIIKLWSVLEKLMGIDKYGTVVRRTAFLYADTEHHRDILNHIRRYRNRIIHGGHSSETRNETIHQLRQCVQQAILFHLRPALRAKRIDDKVQILNLPPRLSDLKKRQKLIEFAIRFRRPPRAQRKQRRAAQGTRGPEASLHLPIA